MAISQVSASNLQPSVGPHRHENVLPRTTFAGRPHHQRNGKAEFVVGSSKSAQEAGGAGATSFTAIAGPSRLPPPPLQRGQSPSASLRSLSPLRGSQDRTPPRSRAPQPEEPLDGASEEDVKPSLNVDVLPLHVGDIKYEYPVKAPLDPNDPNWLEPMMAQLRRERRVVEDHIEDSHMIMGQVTKELFLARAELKEEKKETDDLLKFIGKAAGSAFLKSLLQQLEQGDGELSAESEGEDVPDAFADKGPRPASRKRPREDDVEDDEDSGPEPKIRDAYKRRRQELNDKLKDFPIAPPKPGGGNGPEAGPSRPTKGGKGLAYVAQFLEQPSPVDENQTANSSTSRAAAAQQHQDDLHDLYLNPGDVEENAVGELPVARRPEEPFGDVGDAVTRPDGAIVPTAGQRGSDDSSHRAGTWDLVLWRGNGSNVHDPDRSPIAGPSRYGLLQSGHDSPAADTFLGDHDEVMVDDRFLLDETAVRQADHLPIPGDEGEVYGQRLSNPDGGARDDDEDGEEDKKGNEHPGVDEESDASDDDDDSGNDDGCDEYGSDFGGETEDEGNEDEEKGEAMGEEEQERNEEEEDEDWYEEENGENPYLDDYDDESSDEERPAPRVYYLNQAQQAPPAAPPVPLQPANGANLGNGPLFPNPLQNQNAAPPPEDYEPEMVSRQRDHVHGNHAAGYYIVDPGMSDREHRRVVRRMMAENRAYEREYLGIESDDDIEDSPRTAPTS